MLVYWSHMFCLKIFVFYISTRNAACIVENRREKFIFWPVIYLNTTCPLFPLFFALKIMVYVISKDYFPSFVCLNQNHYTDIVIWFDNAPTCSVNQGRQAAQPVYECRLKSSWTGGNAPLLRRGRRWMLCRVVVVGLT